MSVPWIGLQHQDGFGRKAALPFTAAIPALSARTSLPMIVRAIPSAIGTSADVAEADEEEARAHGQLPGPPFSTETSLAFS